MTQPIKSALSLLAAILALAGPPLGAAETTQWIGVANGLWNDPANWSSGVPSAATDAAISLDHNTSSIISIDLGGLQRPVRALTLVSPYARLINGSLVADSVKTFYSVDFFGPTLSVSVPITSTASTLALTGVSGGYLHVDAPISGNGLAVQAASAIFSAANTYTGDTILPPQARVTFTGQGSANQSASILLSGELSLDNSTNNLTDRLGDSAPIHFSGGLLTINGNATSPTSERVGLLDFGINGGGIALNNHGQPVTLRAPAMQHAPGQFSSISFSPAAGDRILLDTPPTLFGGGPAAPPTARGIIPWLLDPQTNFPLTYDAGTGLRPLDPATEFASTIPAPSPFPANVQLTASQSVTGDASVNFLAIAGATLTLNHSNLTINSNVAVFSSATITGDGALQFPGDATIFGGGGSLNIPIKAHSLTINANDTWTLSQPNDLPGGLNIGYRVIVTHPQALGSGRVHLDEGMRLQMNVGDATLTNDFAFGDVYPSPPTYPGYDPSITNIRSTTGSTITFKGNWTGDLATIGLGAGTFRMNGNGAFDDLNIVASGLFELNGTIAPARTTPAFIRLQGNLAGNGGFMGLVYSGIITPGPIGKPGRLTLHQMLESELDVDITGPTVATDYDQLVILGGLGTRNSLYVDLMSNFVPTIGESFLIVDNQFTGSPGGTFFELPEGAFLTANNTIFQISYTAGDGNDIALTVVPEPALILFAAPLLLIFPRSRRNLVADEHR